MKLEDLKQFVNDWENELLEGDYTELPKSMVKELSIYFDDDRGTAEEFISCYAFSNKEQLIPLIEQVYDDYVEMYLSMFI